MARDGRIEKEKREERERTGEKCERRESEKRGKVIGKYKRERREEEGKKYGLIFSIRAYSIPICNSVCVSLQEKVRS